MNSYRGKSLIPSLELLAHELVLGSLDAKRDWGCAADYVRALWLMLQQSEPADYVIATGESHSVKDLVETAFKHVGLDYDKYTTIDDRLHRPSESYELRGNYAKARKKLNWEPSVKFDRLIHMVDSEIASLRERSSKRA